MKTAGQILQEARLQKKLEPEDVSRITKIRPQFLKYLEADDFFRLPSGAVARGFIRNYSEFLGLKPDYVLAIFRRDFVETDAGRIVPRGLAQSVTPGSIWTPKTTIISLLAVLFIGLAAYLFYQYRLLLGPPPLTLSRPQTDLTTSEPTVEIVGTTDPEATLAINGQLVALEKGGTFSFRIPLVSGQNTIIITSTAKSGKSTTLTRQVTLR